MAETSRYIDETGLQHLAESIDSRFATKTSLTAHTTNTSNPHKVTAAQVGAYSKTESDSTFETKSDATKKTLTFGIDMKYVDTNTLQFCRPSYDIPDPIYEFPQTTFNQNAVVNSNYRLMDTAGTEGSLDEWTLFCNVIDNGQTSDNSRRLMCCGGAIGSPTGSDCNICAGMYKDNAKHIGCYEWGSPWYSFGPETGKLAYRRSKSLSYIQYTLDGYTWLDTLEQTAQIFTDSESYWGWLSFGGVVSRTDRYGKGTISAKLWNSALDNILSLFSN